ncbi:MAG: hypothetical protein ACREV8_00225 [Gammaproteobacteria bacterium]
MVVGEINTLADQAGNSAPTAAERDKEQEFTRYLRAIDGQFETLARDESMGKYNRLLNRSTALSARDEAAADWLKSAVVEKNPAAYVLEPDEKRDFSITQPGLEFRDTLKSTATQALPVSVYDRFITH